MSSDDCAGLSWPKLLVVLAIVVGCALLIDRTVRSRLSTTPADVEAKVDRLESEVLEFREAVLDGLRVPTLVLDEVQALRAEVAALQEAKPDN